MAANNMQIAAIFDEIADLLDIQGGNPFRIRAYRNAGRLLRGLKDEAASLIKAGKDLSELPGIGADLAGKIREREVWKSCGGYAANSRQAWLNC
jgi:DNA polymerase (family 10)